VLNMSTSQISASTGSGGVFLSSMAMDTLFVIMICHFAPTAGCHGDDVQVGALANTALVRRETTSVLIILIFGRFNDEEIESDEIIKFRDAIETTSMR
jgi:hypothetical protein